MSLFRKIFGSTSNVDNPRQNKEGEARSKYMPDIDTPADERFTKNFILNGGRFLYALNREEINDNFDNILLENDWYESSVF
ncbi:MAG: lactate utilization protein B/C, partial [Dokdonia donghaensis]|nr:lactate utilization protein B/C [Dokdonia donghaensis]